MVIDPGSGAAPTPACRLAALLEAEAREQKEWVQRSYRAGTAIFGPQADNAPVCVLLSGLIKLSYPVAGGSEWTKSFIVDRGVFGPAPDQQAVIQFGATALEDCEIGSVRPGWLARQVRESTALQEALASFQLWLFERKRRREEDLLCLAAADRYVRFLEDERALAGRLAQQEIAAYLRITPVALSRIRRRLRLSGRVS